jgi:hypothetical protein
VGPGCESLTNLANPITTSRRSVAFSIPTNLRGNLGRNAVIGPGLSIWIFRFSEQPHPADLGEFQCSVSRRIFNVFNRANFASPVDNLVFDQTGNQFPTRAWLPQLKPRPAKFNCTEADLVRSDHLQAKDTAEN